jgi:hypothetical protein
MVTVMKKKGGGRRSTYTKVKHEGGIYIRFLRGVGGGKKRRNEDHKRKRSIKEKEKER